ncbi:tyrosine-protein phosphatase [Lactococcus nasutitermitis]|uniref:Tyrosine-protein phosphatase n=1 Tax=Lactococcus nasutitermitis TaxID=1652957 RepID=A0ABV9JHH5_9LACT|nr:CpsB/CapC family capsule biosynthesis tyrosine phosphatase [Lactococcus nasutitermitis]
MIDLHCHILPGIDDGPTNQENSLIMLNQAVKEGIDTIVVTPHHNSKYKATVEQIILNRDTLQSIIYDNKIPITLLLGQEIRIYGELLEDFLSGELFSVNKSSRYILVEFPTSDVPLYSENLFYEMRCEGLVPIIVHPERNIKIMKHPELLYRFIENGALSQVTASSITGHFGKKIQKFTYQLLEANLAHFVASDAHDVSYRDFRMKEAFKLLRKKYGSKYTKELDDNARSILLNKKVYVDNPHAISIKKFFWKRLNKK